MLSKKARVALGATLCVLLVIGLYLSGYFASFSYSNSTGSVNSGTSSTLSQSYSGVSSGAGSVEIVSAKLLNTSIGSPIEFNVTFTNNSGAPIYVPKYDGRTSPVSATITPCTTAPGGCASSPIGAYSIQTDCLATVSYVQVSVGEKVYAYTTYCMGPDYQIVAPGTFAAVISLSWSSSPFNTSAANNLHSVSISQNFTVG